MSLLQAVKDYLALLDGDGHNIATRDAAIANLKAEADAHEAETEPAESEPEPEPPTVAAPEPTAAPAADTKPPEAGAAA